MSSPDNAGATGVRADRLTGDELDAFAAARLLALDAMPYLASALFEVIPVRAAGLGTFAIDAEWRLYLDPEQLDRWGPEAAAGVLLHEVGHLLRDHHTRHEEHPHTDGWRWNLAADAEINDDLVDAGIELPGVPITPSVLGCRDGDLAERYFDELLTAEPEEDDPTCGSGAGGDPVPAELDRQQPAGRSELDRELVRRKVAHDIEAAAGGPRAGSVPGGWRRWAARVVEPPQLPWQVLLRRTIRRGAASKAGRLDTSYRRPGRRRVPRVVTPGSVQPTLRVGAVLDTSSSMHDGQLRAALAELDAICRRVASAGEDLLVVTADVEVHEVPRLRRVADLPLLGGGGTDLRPAIAHVTAHRRRPHLLVVLTDGFTPWSDAPPPGCHTIIVLVARVDGQQPAPPPSWAHTVRIST